MLAQIPWWFWVFVAPELAFAAVGLVVFIITAMAAGLKDR